MSGLTLSYNNRWEINMDSRMLSILVLIVYSGCTSRDLNDNPGQTRLPDSLNVPEYVMELDSLTIYPPDPEPLATVRFRKEQQLGKIESLGIPAPFFGIGPKTAVDNMGNVYRADRWQNTIHVYSPHGSKMAEIGREGRGPGEFIEMSQINLCHDQLIAYDARLLRFQLFVLHSTELSKVINLSRESWNGLKEVRSARPNYLACLTDSTFLARVLLNDQNGRSYFGNYIMDWNGDIMSGKILEQQRLQNHQFTLDNGMVGTVQLPFTTKGILDVADDGTIYHANTGEFLIRVYDSGGEYRRAIYYPRKKIPLEREEALDLLHPNIHERVRDAEFPEFWPVLESLIVDDDNRIWVSTLTEDNGVYEWWILNDAGELLATFTWPGNEPIRVIKDGKMYVETEDEETGAKSVVRYQIVMDNNL